MSDMTSSSRYRLLRSLAGVAFVLAVWQVLVSTHTVHSFFLPPLTEVAASLWQELYTGRMLSTVGITLLRFAIALIVGSVIGTSGGIVFGRVQWLYDTFNFWVEFFRSLPVTALFPLFIAAFGTGSTPLLVASGMSSFLIMFVNTIEAFGNIPCELRMLASIARLPRVAKWTSIYLPSMLPQLSQGIRNNISVTFIVVVVSEILMGVGNGLGFAIYEPSLSFRLHVTYGYVLVAGSLGWAINFGYGKMADRLVHWRGR